MSYEDKRTVKFFCDHDGCDAKKVIEMDGSAWLSDAYDIIHASGWQTIAAPDSDVVSEFYHFCPKHAKNHNGE